MDNGIHYKGKLLHGVFPSNKPYLLSNACHRLLDVLKGISDTQIEQIADSIAHIHFNAFGQKQINNQMRENEQQYNFTYTEDHQKEIYRHANQQQQGDLYSRFWNPIEEFTKYDPSSFVRDYLTMKQGKIGRIDRIYFIFKEYAESISINRASLLEDMHHYARIYNQIDNAQISTDKLNRKLNQLRTLDSAIAYPFFMAFFDYTSKAGMSENEIYKVIDVIEAYWARRIICNLPSNVLNKVFATLHRDILNHISKAGNGTEPTYSDVLIYVLLKKGRSSAFPTDEDVAGDFISRQVYKMPTNQRMFILERLENRDNNERYDVVKELTEKNITIEHIMPQTLSDKWKKALGDDWERIHQQYKHTMANLTLTGYNSQYSNLSFVEKRDMEKGFKDSAFRLNNYVKSCDQWTETELKQRQQDLLQVFMSLWPMPTTSFEVTKQEAESASLDDEDFEGIS